MPVPIVYRKSGEGSISTYDFFDLATGKGYKTFYLTASSGALTLNPNPFYSNDKDVRKTGTTALAAGLDFDVEFLKPLTIDGKAIINLPTFYSGGANSGLEVRGAIQKLDINNVLTNIASGAATATYTDTAGNYTGRVHCIIIDIPKTKFKAGETLRVNVFYPTGQNEISFMFDPKNRTSINQVDYSVAPYITGGVIATTAATANIPIVIDL